MGSSLLEYNPLDRQILANPYPSYRSIQENDPIHWNEPLGFWLVTRFDDCVRLLKDTRFSSMRAALLREQHQFTKTPPSPIENFFGRNLLFTDPPKHTPIRSAVQFAFLPRLVENLRPRIQEVTRQLLLPLKKKGALDIIADLAYPLPAIIVSELLGIPSSDRNQLKRWSDSIAAHLASHQRMEAIIEQANQDVLQLNEYFRGFIRKYEKTPEDNLLSHMIAAKKQGKLLTEEDLIANSALILIAGHETTTNLIGNGLLALFQFPDQMEFLRKNPDLISNAIEELLRFDSPVQWVRRTVKENLSWPNKQWKKGDRVLALTGAANRDPEAFDHPDQLNLNRKNIKHLSFGHGAHFCLGAFLARVEGQIAIQTLLDEFPNLSLAPQEFHWRLDVGFRGVNSLKVFL
jgi:hypothetical protein